MKKTGSGPSLTALFAYAPLIGVALWGAAAHGASLPRVMATLVIGLLLWTLIEYLFHRFLFHIVPSSPWLLERQQHLNHHRAPHESAYYVVPLRLSIPMALGTWLSLAGITRSWADAASISAGIMIGYIGYELIHHAVHRGGGRSRIVRFWRRHHFHHHYKDANTCYGFTSPLWDWVFGTTPQRRRSSP